MAEKLTYKYAPKPTRYGGITFRSRLEARWAAFFDVVGWRWEYEPALDMCGWLPDFILHGAQEKVAVEVKPIYKLEELPDDQMKKFELSEWSGDILLLGADGPVSDHYGDKECLFSLGWLHECEHSHPWDRAAGDQSTYASGDGPVGPIFFEPTIFGLVCGKPDFYHNCCYHGRMTGLYDGMHYLSHFNAQNFPGDWWAKAQKLTTWKAPRAR